MPDRAADTIGAREEEPIGERVRTRVRRTKSTSADSDAGSSRHRVRHRDRWIFIRSTSNRPLPAR